MAGRQRPTLDISGRDQLRIRLPHPAAQLSYTAPFRQRRARPLEYAFTTRQSISPGRRGTSAHLFGPPAGRYLAPRSTCPEDHPDRYPLWTFAARTRRVRPTSPAQLSNTGYAEIPLSPCRAAPYGGMDSAGPTMKYQARCPSFAASREGGCKSPAACNSPLDLDAASGDMSIEL